MSGKGRRAPQWEAFHSYLSIPCPTCSAKPGEACRKKRSGKPRAYSAGHPARLKKAQAKGLYR